MACKGSLRIFGAVAVLLSSGLCKPGLVGFEFSSLADCILLFCNLPFSPKILYEQSIAN